MNNTPETAPSSAFEIANVRRFINFRVFFNARYYYPIFTILFLDYGLSLETFALLNVLWAVTIVLAEVPSGALADIVGRRNLLVTGAVLMCIEMAVLILAPVNGGALTVSLFAINRIASGLAEAAVSGADEALAYESLREKNLHQQWPRVLERVGHRISIVMAVAMMTGALLYDPAVVNLVFSTLGLDFEVTKDTTIRIPVILTAAHGAFVLYTALRMQEPKEGQSQEPFNLSAIKSSFVKIGQAAAWTFGHRFVLFVILGGLILDSVARQFVILNSEYYRIIQIPEFTFGFIAAGMSMFGVITARIARYLAENRAPISNLMLLSVVLVTGLYGASLAIPYFGILFAVFIMSMFSIVPFLQSTYINREVEGSQRATVLSFRGLANNLGMGIASLLYTALVAHLKAGADPSIAEEDLQQTVFVDALGWFPWYYLVLLAVLLVAGHIFIRRKHLVIKVPESGEN